MNYSNKTLSITSALFPSLNSALEGMSLDVFFAGCNRHCKGCHNLELQTFIEPNHSIQDILDLIEVYDVKIVTFMGGEVLDQPIEAICNLLQAIYITHPQVRMNLYTGYEMSDIDPRLLGYFGSVKTGRYDESNLSKTGSFLASKNQKYFRRNFDGKFELIYP